MMSVYADQVPVSNMEKSDNADDDVIFIEKDIQNTQQKKDKENVSKVTPKKSSEPKQTKQANKKKTNKKGSCGLSSSLDDEVGFPADIKLETTNDCMPDEDKDFKVCVVCGEKASGFYFGALVCLPCKSFYIRCTKDGEPTFTCQCNGNCDIAKQGRIRCQYCRYQRCLMAGMCRKEKPETVQPAEGQVLCKVCGDIANGIHFGVNTCEGCKKFFRRGLVENQGYNCKGEKSCQINPRNRNNCRYCRYQKCISAGMSREAIKMGRPKKSDGDSPQQSPSHSPSFCDRRSPELSPQGSPNSVHTSPQLSPVNEPLFHKYMIANQPVKTETTCPPPSCQIQSEMTNSRPVLSTTSFMNLKTEEQTAYNWVSSAPTSSWPGSSNTIMSSQCQPVHASTTSHQQENPLLIEDDMDDILNFIQMDQASRSQPQPVFRDSNCLYQTQHGNMGGNTPLMVNTCNNFQQASDNYQQNSGPNSPFQPQYPQPNQSAYYPNSHSPQYYQQPHSPQTNCHSPHSYSTPSPGSCHSPHNYNTPSPGCHSPDTYHPSMAAEYPQQQQQHGGYTMPTTQVHPQFNHGSSMSHDNVYINPDSQHQINQMFIKCIGTINETQTPINGAYVTRDQLTTEVINCTLNSSSPYRNNDCLYSSSDDNSSHDSSDFPVRNKRKNYDQYDRSCGYGNNSNAFMQQSSDFTCESYSLQSTQSYWKQKFPFDPMSRMAEEDHAVIKHILTAYSNMRVFYDESRDWSSSKLAEHWPKMGKEKAHWQHIQERIIRNNKAYVDFVMQIPGFMQLDHEDKQDLCQLASFQAALILCGTEWYNKQQKKFQNFWNFTVSPENPMYLFKLHLLQAGEVINKLELSPVELSLTLALSCFSADLMFLKDPESVESVRRHIIYLLQQHIAEQGINPDERLAAIFNIMPMTRHISMWHKQLMKNMRVNMELGAVSKQVEGISI
ncbi:uncharacterized protein LOC143069171 isoform X1 [Mytilus galloprovincialis]|uniref:uncharacterized protein LOC143069171 isoform X1 n=1 Tax=Mytilus galloprovincialis TaxID=29158 RepID=UPI003F7B6856